VLRPRVSRFSSPDLLRTAVWEGVRDGAGRSSVAAAEQALPNSRARAGGRGTAPICVRAIGRNPLISCGCGRRDHHGNAVLKSTKSPKKRVLELTGGATYWRPADENPAAPSRVAGFRRRKGGAMPPRIGAAHPAAGSNGRPGAGYGICNSGIRHREQLPMRPVLKSGQTERGLLTRAWRLYETLFARI
jgi:hypothetical protein